MTSVLLIFVSCNKIFVERTDLKNEWKYTVIYLALRSFANSTSGRFFCQIHAQQTPLPAPQSVSPSRFINPGQSFPQRPVSYVPAQQTSQQYQPAYQSGFQPSSYQPGYSQQSYQNGNRVQQSYQTPGYYIPASSYRPQQVQPLPPQGQTQTQAQVQVRPPSYQASYQPAYQPGYQASIQPGYQASYQPAYQRPQQPQQSQQPAYNSYQSGYQSDSYQSGYQQNVISSDRKPSYPSYTATQQVYQPLGPQTQPQCQVQCGLRKKVCFHFNSFSNFTWNNQNYLSQFSAFDHKKGTHFKRRKYWYWANAVYMWTDGFEYESCILWWFDHQSKLHFNRCTLLV